MNALSTISNKQQTSINFALKNLPLLLFKAPLKLELLSSLYIDVEHALSKLKDNKITVKRTLCLICFLA